MNGQAPTILGQGSVFEGRLKFAGEVRIDGQFSGEIISAETVIIAPSAKVSADINAARVIVDGTVEGRIRATQTVELHQPCHARCSLETPSLSIDHGVVFDGSCKMAGPAAKPTAGTSVSTSAPTPALSPTPAPAAHELPSAKAPNKAIIKS